ncbi:MAG: nitroreductase family deazaflavin-dependent oxidoreductase [Chloroflexi bacterium]|nr:MAG: nitroreductase family deazaflavin-dependent oxidoreductase [Chloroflexota bacterium]TMG66113.1 MAG: nitroreductase family deazaflavin-dependent oxidoreductase [Chloroflexota bacterium]
MADWNKNIIDEFHAKGGKGIGHFGDNLLLLTTTGARTGERRTNPVAFHRQGDRYVIAATKGGAPSHPAWYHNLVKDPNVTIEVGTEKFPARATVVKGAERDRLYETHASAMPQLGFREYPKRTKRVIPVIVLEPKSR